MRHSAARQFVAATAGDPLLNAERPAAAPSGNLRRLVLLRDIEITGQTLVLAAASLLLQMPLPLVPLASIIGALALLNLLTWLRTRRPWPVTDGELFAQLLADVLALAGLLYFSGGSTNPFVSMFLLPLTLAATILPWRYTWLVAVAAVACYTLLLFRYAPLPPPGPGDLFPGGLCSIGGASRIQPGYGTDFSLHILGMWFNFLLSAVLIALFVVKMAASIRERDRLLASAREETLRNERVVALGTLAAGAAHELGTPLSTMAVVVNELQLDCAGHPGLSEDLRTLRDQVDHCKRILSGLLATAGQARGEGGTSRPLDAYLAELLDKWQLMRPGVTVSATWEGETPAPAVIAEQTLSQALMNLLNNAADASPDRVEVRGRWDRRQLAIEILDRGPGLTPEAAGNAGKAFFTTKPAGHGIGIGLFLANATIERFGGTVQLFNRDGGGACTRVTLPLVRLATGGEA